jgi:hypothetical protein
MNRTSYVILPPLDGTHKTNILQHIAAYRPAVLTVVDEAGFAVECKDVSPDTLVIWRRYHDQDADWQRWSVEDYANYITLNAQMDKRIWVYIWNEPDMNPAHLPAFVEKTLAVVDRVEAMGYHAAVGNIGTANIEQSTIDSGVFDPLLVRAAAWKRPGVWRHIMFYHTYTWAAVHVGTGYCTPEDVKDPAKMQPELWPEITSEYIQQLIKQESFQAQTDVPPEAWHYWHIFREIRLQLRGILIGAGTHEYGISEGLLDRMTDISGLSDNPFTWLEQTYGVPDNTGGEIRGAPTLEYIWAAWWPQWSFDEALWQQNIWMERNAPPECLGWCWFADVQDRYTNKKQTWEPGYNIGSRPAFQALLVANRDAPAHPPEPTPIPPEPEPLPDAPSWMLWVMLGVCVLVFFVGLYSFIAPHIQAQGVSMMEDLLNQLFAIPVFATVTYTAGIVYFLVELIKRLKGKYIPEGTWTWLTPEFSSIVLVVLFLGLHGIAVEYAYENALKEVAKFVTDMIGVLGPYVLGMIATNAVTSYSYDKLRAANVPGFRYNK